MIIGILSYARSYSDQERAKAQARVEIERVALRERLLARDRDGYLTALGKRGVELAGFSNEELALLDLDADPHCSSLNLATAEERAVLDRAIWIAVERNLWLLGRIKLPSCGDPSMDEAHCLDGLRDAIERWDPARGRLGSMLAWRIYTHQRRYRKAQGKIADAATVDETDRVDNSGSDPLLGERLREADASLSDEERKILRISLASDSGTYAAEAGIAPATARHRIAAVRRKIRGYLTRAEAQAETRARLAGVA